MTNKVLLLLLGMVFSGLNVGAQEKEVVDKDSNIVYSYDKSKITTIQEGVKDASTNETMDLVVTDKTVETLDDGSTYTSVSVKIGKANTDHQPTDYGVKVTGIERQVYVSPKKLTALGADAKVHLRTFVNTNYSDSVIGNSYLNDTTLYCSDEDLPEMNKVVELVFAEPTSARETNYVYSSDRLKKILGDSYSSALDCDGFPLEDGICYIWTSVAIRNGRKSTYVDRYKIVDELTVCAFRKVNTVSGNLTCIPDSIPASFLSSFSKKDELTAISIPESIRVIDTGAFAGCKILDTFDLSSNNSYFTLTDGCLYTADGKEIVAAKPSVTNTYELAKTVSVIRDYSFNNNENLIVYHYGASINDKSTHGSTVMFVNRNAVFAADSVYASDGTLVGVYLTGGITKTKLIAQLTKYKKLSFVDMTGLNVTDKKAASPLTFGATHPDNQIYIFGKVNAETANYYVNVDKKNIVYINDDGDYVCSNYVLNETNTLNRCVYIPRDFRAENVTLVRNFDSTDGHMASIVVPFTADAVPTGYKAYNFKYYTPSTRKAKFSSVGGGINANEPCLLYYPSNADTIKFAGADVVVTTEAVVSGIESEGAKMSGVYGLFAGSSSIFDIVNDEDGDSPGRDYMFTAKGGFAMFGENNALDPFRAFIHLPYEYLAGSSSAKLSYDLDDETSTISNAEAEVADTEYYTTDGLKIESQKKGINIVRVANSDGTVKTYKKIVK